MAHHQFIPDLLLRVPLFSFQDYSLGNLQTLAGNPQFQYAIYLANPALHQVLQHKHFNISAFNDKELLSIQKYVNRICFRPTPFGCFSSSTVVGWGNDDQIVLKNNEHGRIHLLLDQEIALLLAKNVLAENPCPRQLYLNPTIYRFNKTYRFVKTNCKEGDPVLSFTLDSIRVNKYIDNVVKQFQKGPIPEAQLLSTIENEWGFSYAEAAEFLNMLLVSQILTTQLEPNLLGEDYLYRLINSPYATDNQLCLQLQALYKKLNMAKPFAQDKLQELDDEIKQLTINNIKKTNLNFYSNLERKKQVGSLNLKYQEQISAAITALQLLVPYALPQQLKDFATEFKARFDKQKIPLLQALDPNTGIVYGGISGTDRGPLLEQVKFSQAAKNPTVIEWTSVHQLLLQLWTNHTNRSTYEPIELTSSHLNKLDAARYPLPPSIMIMFREINDRIFIETAGGCSGTSIIGRFTLFNDDVLDLGRQIAQIEEQANPDVIFADIGILSNTHVDNINKRYPVYQYEIPINTVSVQSLTNQIRLSDLVVSVVDDEVILESVSLGKVIKPRLSSAYNYTHNHLSIFKFLCDLQYQGIQNNLTFDLEYYFPGLKFYPRVSMGNVILSAAKWYFTADDISYPNKTDEHKALQKIQEIKQQIQLPDLICLARADQQLVFDLSKKEDVLLLLNCIAGSEQVKLQEYFLPDLAQSQVMADGKPMINQFITFIYQTDCVYPAKQPALPLPHNKVEREFSLGSDWLYFKIYCNPSSADHLLLDKILPLITTLEKEKEISSWFFIRYLESGYHIRLRLRVNPEKIGSVILKLKDQLAPGLQTNEIKKLQTDTYIREIERYGADIIALVEDFFNASSRLVVHFLKAQPSAGQNYPNHSLAIMDIDRLLLVFMPGITDQVSFLQLVSDNFYQEFSGNKTLKVDLDLKYRELKAEIRSILTDPQFFKTIKLEKYHAELISRATQITAATLKFTAERKAALLADIIHMHFNRLFTEDQREQEYIIYYCMLKHKLSVKAQL